MSGAVSEALPGLSYLSHQQPMLHYLPWLPLCLASSSWFSLTLKVLPCCGSSPASPPLQLSAFECFLSHFYSCRFSWCCSTGAKEHACLYQDAADTPWGILFQTGLTFFLFFQIHSVNLKITTCLSSSSAFLFDNCGSRTRQDDYLPDAVHKLTVNRHVIYIEKTVFACGKMHLGRCLFSISNETSFCFQIVLTYPQVGCLYIQHHLKCLCYHHCSVSKSRSFSPVIWVLAGRWMYFQMEVLLNPWLILFILYLSLILFSKLLF